MVSRKDLIDGQRILIVDDEPDILKTLEDLLPTCDITTATTFEEGKEYLERQEFDLAILAGRIHPKLFQPKHPFEGIRANIFWSSGSPLLFPT